MTEDDNILLDVSKTNSTPLYVYSLDSLRQRAEELTGLSLPFGYIPRYAAKANMNPEIIKTFNDAGIWFDASSSYEAMELIGLGVDAKKISLSSQQPAHNLDTILKLGVQYVATSLYQLKSFIGSANKTKEVGLRINPGTGAGSNNRLSTGGPNSSFGLWYEYLENALTLAKDHNVSITRLHIHYGSGADPSIWSEVIDKSLEIASTMPEVTSVDVGGGFKISRFNGEREADIASIVAIFSTKIAEFAKKTGRKLCLEIEPGTWLVAHSGVLLSKVIDIVDTGTNGHTFLRLDTGMNDFIRPAIYGAQHKIRVLNKTNNQKNYVVVGHNCESGDILTPATGNPEELSERTLNEASIGDMVVIYDTGAYGRYFAVQGYNSFPSAKEIYI